MTEYITFAVAVVPALTVIVGNLFEYLKNKNQTILSARSAAMEKLYDQKRSCYHRYLHAVAIYLRSKETSAMDIHDFADEAMLFMDDEAIELSEQILSGVSMENKYRQPDISKEELQDQHKMRMKNIETLARSKKKLLRLLARDLRGTTTL